MTLSGKVAGIILVLAVWLRSSTVLPTPVSVSTSGTNENRIGQPLLQPTAPFSTTAYTWPAITLSQVISGLTQPIAIANAGDSSNRLFIVEKTGRIKIYLGGVYQTTFLDIHSKVSTGSEQGLLCVVFAPGYALNGRFYIDYTNLAGDTVIARYQVSADPNLANPNSEEILLTIDQPYSNHNGGQLAFGPDGYLYIGMGDGGSAGDPQNRAQDPAVLLGKILRIDVGEQPASSTYRDPLKSYFPLITLSITNTPYRIPSDNPFINTPGYRPEIWAMGLRNPWRFSFDRQTHDLLIADVGQDSWEEIDFQPAASPGGENYGWRILEGNHCYNPSSGCIPPADYVPPILEYSHGTNDSNGCSVTGGYVYRGSAYPTLQGIYFYGDYCKGKIWGAVNSGGWQTQLLTTAPFLITTFGEDEAGTLYVADFGNGKVFRIQTN